MKFKVTLRNKFTAETTTSVLEGQDEQDMKDRNEPDSGWEWFTVRPLRLIGEKAPKEVKSTYVSIKRLRARKERDLCNQQMHLGKYSPEAIEAELRKELAQELGE